MNRVNPHVFWLFGLSGAGKSTLAKGLSDWLRRRGVTVLALDGDALRGGLCRGLGFSEGDRAENLRRAAEAAKLSLESGIPVVASFITPLETHRTLIRGAIGEGRVSLVHVNAPLAVCQSRDVKGLYARANAGQIAQMTGVTSSFEPPSITDLTLSSDQESVAQCVERLAGFASHKLQLQTSKSPA